MSDLLDKAKTYLVNVVAQKYVPVALSAGVASLAGLMASNADLLESWGITTGAWPLKWPTGQDPTGLCTVIEWDTLKVKGAIAIVVGISVLARAIQHHTTGTPTDPSQPAKS